MPLNCPPRSDGPRVNPHAQPCIASRLREARRCLADQADGPADALAPALIPLLGDVLARSWQRSAQAGLAPQGRRHGAPHASAAQLARAMQRQYELLSHAQPVLDYMAQQVAGTPSLLILADAQGMLLRTLGDDEVAGRAERVALRPGAQWAEAWRGTNAIGTALAEEAPVVVLTVTDADGQVVRRIEGPAKAGLQRVSWDLRYPAPDPSTLVPVERDPWTPEPVGPLVAPGKYQVTLAARVDGQLLPLGAPQSFDAAPLGGDTLPVADRQALLAFQRKTGELQRAALGAVNALTEALTRVALLKKALADAPAADPALIERARVIENGLKDVQDLLVGDAVRGSHSEPVPTPMMAPSST